MQCSAVLCSAVQFCAVQFSFVQYSVLECSALECSAAYLEENALKCSTVQLSGALPQLYGTYSGVLLYDKIKPFPPWLTNNPLYLGVFNVHCTLYIVQCALRSLISFN